MACMRAPGGELEPELVLRLKALDLGGSWAKALTTRAPRRFCSTASGQHAELFLDQHAQRAEAPAKIERPEGQQRQGQDHQQGQAGVHRRAGSMLV